MPKALALLLACLLLSGCFVFDELEAGQEILDKTGPQKEAPAEPGDPEARPPTGSDWWSKAKSIGPGAADADPDDPTALVSCRISGATRFMRRGDCLSQGGRPRS